MGEMCWLSKVSLLIKPRLGPVATNIKMTCPEYDDFVNKDVFIPSVRDLSKCWREMNEWNMYLSPIRTSTQKVTCSQHEIYYYVTERCGCYWRYYCLHKTQRQTYQPQLTGNTACTLIQTPHEHYKSLLLWAQCFCHLTNPPANLRPGRGAAQVEIWTRNLLSHRHHWQPGHATTCVPVDHSKNRTEMDVRGEIRTGRPNTWKAQDDEQRTDMSAKTPHSQHRFPAPSSTLEKECRKPVPGVCRDWRMS